MRRTGTENSDLTLIRCPNHLTVPSFAHWQKRQEASLIQEDAALALALALGAAWIGFANDVLLREQPPQSGSHASPIVQLQLRRPANQDNCPCTAALASAP